MRHVGRFTVLFSLMLMVACTKSADEAAPTLRLTRSPEFVNRIIPGQRPVALVDVATDDGTDVGLAATATIDGAIVTLQPATITGSGVAEVWVDLPEVTEEVPFTVTVTGTAGTTEQAITIAATAIPGIDDLAATAQEIVQVFLTDLAATVPGLPADAADLTGGTPVAGLLVVSHYAWFTDEYEIGLAWHIMIAPDDFAELTIRPRDQLTPTAAYRVGSWSTALADGEYTITEIPPPTEVTR